MLLLVKINRLKDNEEDAVKMLLVEERVRGQGTEGRQQETSERLLSFICYARIGMYI